MKNWMEVQEKTSLKVIDSPSGAIKNTGTTIRNTFQGLLGSISGTVT